MRAHRQWSGLTQEELAERAGLCVRSIGNLETGRTVPRPRTVRLLADAFGLSGAERDRFCRSATGEATVASTRVPAQLPPDVSSFVGRAEQVAWLDTRVTAPAGRSSAVVISAIAGTPGIGKTALAVHWAHRVVDRFPDGQLYVNLRGYDPDQPMTAADALAGFLTALGVPGQDVSLDVAERAARYRTELAGRRMLIILDNAATADQVRPLLPGAPSCAVVVTSRDNLPGLVAVHGAHRLEHEPLPHTDAISLLRLLIGPRADAEPDAAATLAKQCTMLPLALRIVAELAVSRPTTPIADLASELADHQRRLDLLDAGGDPHAAVTAVFSWSIRHLPEATARTFRLLSLHPGPDLDPYAAAALANTDLSLAHQTLDVLARAHLIHSTGPCRYGIHDLLRAYAARLATEEDTDRDAASDRLFDYYLAASATAMDHLHPAEKQRRPRISPVGTPTPDLAGPDSARRWLNTELPALAAAAVHTAARGWPAHTVQVSATLHRYLDGGHHTEALTIHGHAHRAAQLTGNQAGQAVALFGLGTAYLGLGQYELAADHLGQALALFRQTGDQLGEARTLISLGGIRSRLGHGRTAAEHFRLALALSEQIGDRTEEARSLLQLGINQSNFGRLEQAVIHFKQALHLSRQADNRVSEAHALNSLGLVETRLGRCELAASHLRQALRLFRLVGDLRGEAHALDNLGTLHIRLHQPEHACEYLWQALTLFRKSGDRNGETSALISLGEAARTAGRATEALTHYHAAHATAAHLGERYHQARANIGLGNAFRDLDDHTRAREHYEQALTICPDLGDPQADDIRAHVVR